VLVCEQLMKKMDFPPEFDQKVDMKKIRWEVMKPWVTQRVTELLGVEDEVVISMIFNVFESEQFVRCLFVLREREREGG
jgi:hypothetical protein